MATLNTDARVSAEEVNEIMDSVISENDMKAFINWANNLVDAQLTNKGLSSGSLKDIEKFLAAHSASLRDRREERISAEGSSFTWEGDTGLGLDHTGFGQMAKTADWTGTLAEIDQRAKGDSDSSGVASIDARGKDPGDRYTDGET